MNNTCCDKSEKILVGIGVNSVKRSEYVAPAHALKIIITYIYCLQLLTIFPFHSMFLTIILKPIVTHPLYALKMIWFEEEGDGTVYSSMCNY